MALFIPQFDAESEESERDDGPTVSAEDVRLSPENEAKKSWFEAIEERNKHEVRDLHGFTGAKTRWQSAPCFLLYANLYLLGDDEFSHAFTLREGSYLGS